jgi:hypothetical protein
LPFPLAVSRKTNKRNGPKTMQFLFSAEVIELDHNDFSTVSSSWSSIDFGRFANEQVVSPMPWDDNVVLLASSS